MVITAPVDCEGLYTAYPELRTGIPAAVLKWEETVLPRDIKEKWVEFRLLHSHWIGPENDRCWVKWDRAVPFEPNREYKVRLVRLFRIDHRYRTVNWTTYPTELDGYEYQRTDLDGEWEVVT